VESLEVTAGFWQNRRVLITGHTGFKGAWLALWLREMGARVAGYSLAPPTQPSLYAAAGVRDSLETEAIADIRNLAALSSFSNQFNPELIVHLAAQSLVRRSYADPRETFDTNAIGTANLLEAARACGSLRAVVVVTSDKCYRNDGAAGRPFVEDDALGGDDPYSGSKACAEILSTAYRAAFFRDDRGAAVASARAGNVIGGGDWSEDRLLTDAVLAFAGHRAVRLRNPQSTRPWQHVLDALNGYLVLGEALLTEGMRHAGSWNFGPAGEDERPVSWVVERIAARWGNGASWRTDGGSHPKEAAALRLDSAKARARLGWRPRLDLERAIEWTTDWYRGHLSAPASARALCVEQIARFRSLAAA
jgi:CDP-glucose 4,6-dehydratase